MLFFSTDGGEEVKSVSFVVCRGYRVAVLYVTVDDAQNEESWPMSLTLDGTKLSRRGSFAGVGIECV